jgi:uncharacterized protein YgbK (DUF1537 family)
VAPAADQPDLPSAEAVFAAAPDPLVVADARPRIRAWNRQTGRRIAVLDDDPTGSQSVHDVAIVTVMEAAEYEAGLAEPGSTCFVLTNSRSLSEADAIALSRTVGRSLFELGARLGVPIEVVSRSDSTLRGHVVAEVRALDAARREVTGAGYDGVLLVPAFFEAGRVTAGDIHWARTTGEWLPVGETEFARDASFGYAASDLKQFLGEKSAGAIAPADVHSIQLTDIRSGGPDRVAEILGAVTAGAFVVVNATEYADLEVVVLGVQAAQRSGSAFLYRSGPSFVRALAGLEPREPLTAADIWPAGHPGGHGLVVVGSHVGLTTRQLDVARSRGGVTEIEVDVTEIASGPGAGPDVEAIADRVGTALRDSDVILFTSRTLMGAGAPGDSLRISRAVSTAVVDIVRSARAARPAWVIAKGGITSHDVATRGLGIRRADVLGQMQRGIVSVLRPVEAAPEAVGMPYVVFPGNVGDDATLADVVDVLRGGA